ncbi:DUF3784 domain-containing protein [Metaplanococcus flavidus]|uniref:DUF3784 domain-containing protein n=1 Tax=Metaplanococcus flavidus TaxID=569883 RepID=A0ABW3LB78_9BACL
MMTEIIVSTGSILLLLSLGLYMLQGKGAMLIAGYNTMPKEEKEKYDEVALCKATGKFILGLTFTIALISLGSLLRMNGLIIAGTVLMVVLIVFGLIYINTGERYKKDVN